MDTSGVNRPGVRNSPQGRIRKLRSCRYRCPRKHQHIQHPQGNHFRFLQLFYSPTAPCATACCIWSSNRFGLPQIGPKRSQSIKEDSAVKKNLRKFAHNCVCDKTKVLQNLLRRPRPFRPPLEAAKSQRFSQNQSSVLFATILKTKSHPVSRILLKIYFLDLFKTRKRVPSLNLLRKSFFPSHALKLCLKKTPQLTSIWS